MVFFRKITLRFLGVFGLVAALLWLGLQSDFQEKVFVWVEQLGYVGMFIGASVSGFNLIVPFPFITLLPLFVSAGLSFWLSVLIISLGMTTGDLVGYLIGNAGRDAIGTERIPERITRAVETLEKKHHTLPYFLLFVYVALVPWPNEVIVVPMSFLGYHLRHMATAIVIGNLVFNTVAGLILVGALSFFVR